MAIKLKLDIRRMVPRHLTVPVWCQQYEKAGEFATPVGDVASIIAGLERLPNVLDPINTRSAGRPKKRQPNHATKRRGGSGGGAGDGGRGGGGGGNSPSEKRSRKHQ